MLFINVYNLQAYPRQIVGDANSSFNFQSLKKEQQVQLSGLDWDL